MRTLLTPTENALLASCRTSNEVLFCEALIEEMGPLSGGEKGITSALVPLEARPGWTPAPPESGHITQEDMQLWG